MIYTVFLKNYDKEYECCYLPQDFPTKREAVEYGENLITTMILNQRMASVFSCLLYLHWHKAEL